MHLEYFIILLLMVDDKNVKRNELKALKMCAYGREREYQDG